MPTRDPSPFASQDMNIPMAGGLPEPPPVPGADEIYDMIMSGIEPDLTLVNMGSMREKYTKETPAENKKRLARYDAAFKEYNRQFGIYAAALQAQGHRYQRAARSLAEGRDRQGEQTALKTISSTIADS